MTEFANEGEFKKPDAESQQLSTAIHSKAKQIINLTGHEIVWDYMFPGDSDDKPFPGRRLRLADIAKTFLPDHITDLDLTLDLDTDRLEVDLRADSGIRIGRDRRDNFVFYSKLSCYNDISFIEQAVMYDPAIDFDYNGEGDYAWIESENTMDGISELLTVVEETLSSVYDRIVATN